MPRGAFPVGRGRGLDYLGLIRSGLPARTTRPKKVLIVGAGMAGLVAAAELLRAGHDPLILEAQHRVGGRVQTLRDPFAPGLYAEAGAMRIPRSHTLTLAYVEKFGLPVAPFAMNNPRAYYHLQGQRMRIGEADADPGRLNLGLGDQHADRTVTQLWTTCLQPIIRRLEEDGEAVWPELASRYDQYSVREFLELNEWPEEAVELFGLLWNQEALMNSSFLELLREEAGRFYTDMLQIEGGMDRLPRAFLPTLANRIHFSARMIAIDQTPHEVIVHYRTRRAVRRLGGSTPFSPCRFRCCATSKRSSLSRDQSSGPSGSCTTTFRPRFSSSAERASGRRTKGSSAGGP